MKPNVVLLHSWVFYDMYVCNLVFLASWFERLVNLLFNILTLNSVQKHQYRSPKGPKCMV
jgi:hypothetical protein